MRSQKFMKIFWCSDATVWGIVHIEKCTHVLTLILKICATEKKLVEMHLQTVENELFLLGCR